MKLLLHDYGGHAFTGQLASQLAEMGFDVTYAWFAGFPGPKGRWASPAAAAARFSPQPIDISAAFDKDNLLRRGWQQLEYGRRLAELVDRELPDVVVSANSPIEVQHAVLRAVRRNDAAFVYWLQDIHSDAIASALGKRSALLGRVAGAYYRAEEKRLIRSSDGVVAIAPAFREILASRPWRIATNNVSLIENWAPLVEIPLVARDNDWAAGQMRPERLRIVYAGTLARKHNPQTLVDLAQRVDADIWLFSEGSVAQEVGRRARASGLTYLFVRPWLRSQDLPSALGGADVLCAIIDADAGKYSVPSKVLSYLAAGRPILAALPLDNLAAATLAAAGAGLVSPPGDCEKLVANAKILLEDSSLRSRLGDNGRRYAARHFDLTEIGRRFADLIEEARCQAASGSREAYGTFGFNRLARTFHGP